MTKTYIVTYKLYLAGSFHDVESGKEGLFDVCATTCKTEFLSSGKTQSVCIHGDLLGQDFSHSIYQLYLRNVGYVAVRI